MMLFLNEDNQFVIVGSVAVYLSGSETPKRGT